MLLQLVYFALTLAAAGAAPVERSTRIVNGEAVDIREVPYQAALRTSRSGGWTHLCGAVVVAQSAALTAAHCVEGAEEPALYRVVVGTSYREAGGREHPVAAVVVHPQYSELVNDVAVLRVATAFTYSATVQPVALAAAGAELAAGTAALVSGYGTLYFSGPSSRTLQAAEVRIVSAAACADSYRGLVSPSMVCAGAAEPARDACQGDSGGPLAAGGVLVGLVSWGEGCAEAAYPGVYTKISAFHDWIEENIQ